MSIYLKWAGAGIILLCALFVGKDYSAYIKKRLSEYRGFTELILHIEGMISRFLTPQDSLWQNFSSDALEKCGFLSALRSGKGLSEAFDASKPSLSLSDELKDRLSGFFHGFGGEYLDGEISRTSDFRSELEDGLKVEESELEKSLKITNALLLAGAVGIVILII